MVDVDVDVDIDVGFDVGHVGVGDSDVVVGVASHPTTAIVVDFVFVFGVVVSYLFQYEQF